MKNFFTLSALALSILFASNSQAAERCYKVTSVYTGTGTPGNTQISNQLPNAQAGSWSGACDSCNGSLNLPSTIDVNGWGTSIPYLTNVATSNNIPFTTYGQRAGYHPDFVFARCHPSVPVYEAYSTNGDSSYGGLVGSDTWGIQDGYPTRWQKIAIVIKNDLANQNFTSTWKQRLLNPNPDSLDKDTTGYNLVKAKNLSSISVQLYLINKTSGGVWGNANRRYTYTQPNGYIALQAPGLSNINIGQPHANSNWNGWHTYWPGAIGLYLNTELRFTNTCIITTNTPYINFPNVTAEYLNASNTIEREFTVTTECDAGATSGTALNQTSIGIVVNPLSIDKSAALGLTNSKGGISHLISIDYDNAATAKGVGVKILRGTTELNLLSNRDATIATAADAPLIGWYPILASTTTISAHRVDTQIFKARFEKLPGSSVTATTGAFMATAEIVVTIQ